MSLHELGMLGGEWRGVCSFFLSSSFLSFVFLFSPSSFLSFLIFFFSLFLLFSLAGFLPSSSCMYSTGYMNCAQGFYKLITDLGFAREMVVPLRMAEAAQSWAFDRVLFGIT